MSTSLRPLREEISRKFAGNVRGLLEAADRDRVADLVAALDSAAHVRALCEILAHRVHADDGR